MAELVDATDLKSVGLYRGGSIPPALTNNIGVKMKTVLQFIADIKEMYRNADPFERVLFFPFGCLLVMFAVLFLAGFLAGMPYTALAAIAAYFVHCWLLKEDNDEDEI